MVGPSWLVKYDSFDCFPCKEKADHKSVNYDCPGECSPEKDCL